MSEPDFAHTEHAERAREEKASAIAWWCWDHDVPPAELAGLDVKARGRVARSAGVNAPRGWATWAVVVGKLEQLPGWAAANPGHPRARQGGLGRPEWLPTTENDPAKNISSASPKVQTGAAAADAAAGGSPEPGGNMLPVLKVIPGGGGDALADAIARHPAGRGRLTLPAGWQALVDSKTTLGHGRVCGFCPQPAVAACLTVLRCADHPPQAGEWGHRLDWTPRARECAPNRCYCGQHTAWRPTPVPSVPTEAETRRRDERRQSRSRR